MSPEQQIKRDFIAILSLLSEEDSPVPKTPIYMALGSDLDRLTRVSMLLESAGVVKMSSETMTLTAKGREMAAKVNEIMAG